MKLRAKIALAVVLTLVLSAVTEGGFALLNIANDLAFFAGILVLLLVFVFGFTGYYLIFRKETKLVRERIIDFHDHEDDAAH